MFYISENKQAQKPFQINLNGRYGSHTIATFKTRTEAEAYIPTATEKTAAIKAALAK